MQTKIDKRKGEYTYNLQFKNITAGKIFMILSALEKYGTELAIEVRNNLSEEMKQKLKDHYVEEE